MSKDRRTQRVQAKLQQKVINERKGIVEEAVLKPLTSENKNIIKASEDSSVIVRDDGSEILILQGNTDSDKPLERERGIEIVGSEEDIAKRLTDAEMAEEPTVDEAEPSDHVKKKKKKWAALNAKEQRKSSTDQVSD